MTVCGSGSGHSVDEVGLVRLRSVGMVLSRLSRNMTSLVYGWPSLQAAAGLSERVNWVKSALYW